MNQHTGRPVAGYKPQSDTSVAIVNDNKVLEERVLRQLDALATMKGPAASNAVPSEISVDHRWLAIGRTHIEQGFMAVNRAVFKPGRVELPEDTQQGTVEAAFRIAQIARACHEANRAYCAALGDHSQPAWADAPDWQRQSAVTGVQFTLANPDAPPSASHESWLEEKRRDGWVYGAVKNAETKEHPCFVPYDELPREQRAKDYIFQAIVRSLA